MVVLLILCTGTCWAARLKLDKEGGVTGGNATQNASSTVMLVFILIHSNQINY